MSLADAERFLRARYGSRAGAVTPLGAGDWSRVFAVTLDGREMAVKFGAYTEDFAKDALMAVHSSGSLPIPAVHDSGPIAAVPNEVPVPGVPGGGPMAAGPDGGMLAGGALAGGCFAVSQRARGDFLDQIDEAGMRAVLPALLAALRTIRDIRVPGPGGYGLWRSDGTAPHQSWRDALLDVTIDRPGSRTHGWRQALAGSPTGAGPFDDAADALRELAPPGPQPRQLIHSDLLYRNVLVQGAAVTAVLDWGNSMYGDGLYDLAWLLYWWPWFPAWREIDIAMIIREHLAAAGEWRDDTAARLRCYQIHIGLDTQAYNAFTGRWQELASSARQTTALAERA